MCLRSFPGEGIDRFIFNIQHLFADDLATLGARASTAMVLVVVFTQICTNIQALAPEGFNIDMGNPFKSVFVPFIMHN